jgi:hypothetical protein
MEQQMVVSELVTFRLGNCYLKRLPEELLTTVLSYLDDLSARKLSRTCKYLKSVVTKEVTDAEVLD